jgi:HK97 family phage major capsid protein
MELTQTELRLQVKTDQREQTNTKLEDIHRELEGGEPTEGQKTQMANYRSDIAALDAEIDVLAQDAESDRVAKKRSDDIRRAQMAARGVQNRHARAHIGTKGVAQEDVQRAAQRLQALERTPATTLTSDIAGLTPPQHIAEIFQIINNDRPLVDAAGIKRNLTNLVYTYPQVDASPVVAAQGTQKTEAGNTGMDISMVTKTATTYLGGGNLSWQAIEFSDPSAYDLWFRLIAADYALKTETDAATIVSASAFLNNITTTLATNADFATTMTAIGAGYNEVYANSGRTANALIMAPDRFGYLLGLTSAALTQFISVGQTGIGPLRTIVSRGLNAGEMIVGDMNGLLVAENAGAPVRMFVSEPAIAGVEVGLVGAFDAAVVDDGAFALISTAS